jgi:hypothetical protein
MTSRILVGLLGLALFVPSAFAASSGEDLRRAATAVTDYLRAVKGRNWAEARRLTHPRTLEHLAELRKRSGRDKDPMAPWSNEGPRAALRSFEVKGTRPAPEGAVIADVSEERGSGWEQVSYVLGRRDGAWRVADRQEGGTFSDERVRARFRGYFDGATGDAGALPLRRSTREEEE